MRCDEEAVRLDSSERPEFDHWQWVDYWYPLRAVVPFKRHVYWRALHELAPLLPAGSAGRRGGRRRSEEYAAGSTESARVSTVLQHVTVLQMQQVESSQNPVITRMVVATRRLNTLDSPSAAPAPPEAMAALEESREARSSRTAASGRQRWCPR